MNYFERLIRRARMQPADKPGGTLIDPFENVDDWPLEAIAAELERRGETPADIVPLRVETVVQSTVGHERTIEQPGGDVPGGPLADASSAPVEQSAPDRPTAGPVPLSPSLDTPDVTPEIPEPVPAPLDVADAFMRTLGVPVPGRSVQARTASPPAPTAPLAAPRTTEAAPPPPRAQIVSPPPAPVPAPSPLVASTPPAAPATTPHAASADREPPPRAPRIVETRRVVVVERQSEARSDKPIAGGGSPRFGLGQL